MGPSPARSAGLGFFSYVGKGEHLCEICVCRGGVLGGGSCRKGDLGSRHDQEGEMGHAGREICGKSMTGGPPAPAKKEKQVCGVCGASTKPIPKNKSLQTKKFPQPEGFSI